MSRSKASLAAVASCLVFAAISACGQATPPPAQRNFDRPTEMSFACYGDLVVDGQITSSAQPLSSCAAHKRGEPPAGQDGVVAPEYFGFVLQPALGTVAVVNVLGLGVQDNDSLTPGQNDIPVGTLPVGMAEDYSGCFILTANSGSCDLASINAGSAIDLRRSAEVTRRAITTPAGAPLLARPRQMATGPQSEVVGNACPAAAEGLVYLSFPDCNLVAAVQASSGVVQAALAFRSDGSIVMADESDFAACPLQCGDGVINVALGSVPGDGDVKPGAIQVSADGTKLYISGENSPLFTIVDLDSGGLPTTTITRIRVAPDASGREVGLKNFAVSDTIQMGGNILNSIVFPVGDFQFAYAIATDSTVRVLDLTHSQECDTQVDPRYLKDETDVDFLSCMPVGDLRTPPRRAGAVGPGIQLPGRRASGRNGLASLSVPLDIAFATLAPPDTPPAISEPNSMIGSFAFVSASSGEVYVINVDDDAYSDTEDPAFPMSVSLPLALPHQLRDDVGNRGALSDNCGAPISAQAGARISGAPSQIVDPAFVATSKVHELPFFEGLACAGTDSVGNATESIVTELSFAADEATRKLAFADLRVVEDQRWSLAWEGSLSADGRNSNIDGPVTRKGSVARDGNRVFLRDSGSPFCAAGVEQFDIVDLVGCDPLQGNSQCGVGETCHVHPDTSSSVRTGVCMPSDQVDALSNTCRDFLTSHRRYSVLRSAKDQLELVERRRMLRTTPLGGCESASQCGQLALREPLLAMEAHPIEAVLPDPVQTFSWVCEADPSRKPGVDRCLMSCASQSDCEAGFQCSGQRCVEAPLPPAQCLPSVQRYKLMVGEAFAVIGADDGYLSALIADPQTGACVRPTNANPLVVGRIPLRPEPCDDDGNFFTGPNPCATTVANAERFVPFVVENGRCVAQDVQTRVVQMPAVRFANPALRFHLVGTETQGDLDCRADLGGQGPAYAASFAGYQILFDIVGGFKPKRVPNISAALPSRIAPGPNGNLWILDQGDSSALDRGRLLRINPRAPGAFDLSVLQ